MNRQVKLTIIAGVLLALPFVVFIGETNTTRVNGVVTNHQSINYFAVVAALIGLTLAWRIAFMWESESDRQPKWKVVAGLIAVAAVLRGVFGIGIPVM